VLQVDQTIERGKAVGGYAPALECGGLRCAPAALRCSGREGGHTNSPSRGRDAAAAAPLRSELKQCVADASPQGDAQPSQPCAPRRRICRCRRTPAHGFAGTIEAWVDALSEHRSAVGSARWGRLVGRRASQQRARRALCARIHLWLAAIVRAQRPKGV